MVGMLIPAFIACIITLVVIPYWIKVCRARNLFEQHDDRKKHKLQIPSMGGIGIFAGIIISTIYFLSAESFTLLKPMIIASFMLFFTGFFDDLLDISAIKKLFVQIFAAIFVCYHGTGVHQLYGMFNIYEIPTWGSYLITVFCIVWVTNAYNLIDGIDGLAGSLGLLSSMILGVLFMSHDHEALAIFSFCITGSLLGFLIFNFHPAKIFMGDTGSLVVGFLLAVLAIECLSINDVYNGSNMISPNLVVAIIFIPLYDVVRVSVIRMLLGYSPFKPDRNHLHHMIISQGFGQRVTTMLILMFQCMFILLSVLFNEMNLIFFIVINICLGMITMNTLVMAQLANIWSKLGGRIYAKQFAT